jgi:hypothetical protein
MSEHLGQELTAALKSMLKESAPEEVPQADGWAAVLPLWRMVLSAVGRLTGLREGEIEDMIQDVLLLPCRRRPNSPPPRRSPARSSACWTS